MNKILILLTACCALLACSNREKLKAEIKAELQKEMVVNKGTGYYWYNEPIIRQNTEYFIHHSTLDCPAIKTGVLRGYYKRYREYYNYFCPKCMDDELITKWENEHEEKFKKDK